MPKVMEEDLPVYRRIGFSGRNYKIVKGGLEGTRVWESGDYAYTYERENGKVSTLGGLHPVIKLKCKRYHAKYGKCPVRAAVCEDGLLEITRGEHNHCAAEERAQLTQMAAANTVRDRMRENPTSDPKDVFDSYQGPGATDLEFPKYCRQLQNIKNQALTRAPRNVEETIEAVRASEYSYLLKDVARYNDHTALIWYPDVLGDILSEWEVEEISADGTFRVVPEVFGTSAQHFTILGRFKENWLPMIHVTMTCKVEGLYHSVLDKIKTRLTEFNPKIAHCDFEPAIANSLEAAWNCEVKGCWFHYCSACRKKFGNVGLFADANKNRSLDAWLRSFYPLALLPAEKIADGYQWVKDQLPTVLQTFEDDVKRRECQAMCIKVNRYWERFWLAQVGEEKLSVYGQKHRTNNGAENYHSRLNKGLPRRPKFWLYPPRIKKFCDAFVLDTERLKKGKVLTRANKETEVQRRITQYTNDFDRTQDLEKFLKRSRWLAGKKCKVEDSDSDSDIDAGPVSPPPSPPDSDSSPERTPPPPPVHFQTHLNSWLSNTAAQLHLTCLLPPLRSDPPHSQ